MKPKILVTGALGMLGSDLIPELEVDYNVYGLVRNRDERPQFFECDITDRSQTIKAIERVNPRVVVHCAALTDVDRCENDRQLAAKVNFEGTKHVVDGARHVKATFIYISTDFVFSGNSREPYKETKLPHPMNVYGETKLLGEFYVREQSQNYIILRASWLFGAHGKNFMSKILERAQETQEIQVVQDQKGSPTYTPDLAKAIHRVIDVALQPESKEVLNAIYHVSNLGIASRYEVAAELIRQAGFSNMKVVPIDSTELKSLAKRPKNSALDNSRFQKVFNMTFRPWQEAVSDYLKHLPKGEHSHQ